MSDSATPVVASPSATVSAPADATNVSARPALFQWSNTSRDEQAAEWSLVEKTPKHVRDFAGAMAYAVACADGTLRKLPIGPRLAEAIADAIPSNVPHYADVLRIVGTIPTLTWQSIPGYAADDGEGIDGSGKFAQVYGSLLGVGKFATEAAKAAKFADREATKTSRARFAK